MPDLDIIIVNWNAGKQLYECLKSIETSHPDGFRLNRVVVVDNASTDGSVDCLDDIIDLPLIIIRNTQNRGFAAACNQGAKESNADYLLFLNPDTRLFENSLSWPIRFMEYPKNKKIGICGIQLVDEKGNASTSAARFPTLQVMAGKILGLAKLFPGVFPSHLMESSHLQKSCLVDQVIGAFFLIRKNVFECCGGFDEHFFVYFEEVDLALRAKQMGYSSFFISEVAAFHKGGGCSERVKAARLFYSLRSRILYAQKHYSKVGLIVLVFLTVFELPLRLLQGLLTASWLDISNTFAAYMQLITYFVRRV